MFQKENSSKGSKNDVPLGKKEKKKLRDTVCNLFQSVDGAVIDKIFMEGSISARKIVHDKLGKVMLYFKSPSNDVASWPYSRKTHCVWMSVETGHNQVLHAPTVALLSVVPTFPTVQVPSIVSKFICRGANLMRAGIHKGCLPEPMPIHGIVAVCVSGNSQPFCVGQISVQTTSSTIGPGSHGVGVQVWTSYGDDLWKTTNRNLPTSFDGLAINENGGAHFENGHYGNIGFIEGKIVRAIEDVDYHHDDENEVEDDIAASEDHHVDLSTSVAVEVLEAPTVHDYIPIDPIRSGNVTINAESTKKEEKRNISAPSLLLVDATRTDDVTVNNRPTNIDLNGEYDLVTNDTIKQTDKDDDNNNTHDTLLHQAVCKALVNINDKDLPMATHTFYATHVLPSRPLDTMIQLKKTSWKKFGSYLLDMQRQELLTVSADREKNETGFLQSVNRRHLDLRDIKKEKVVDRNTKAKIVILMLYIIPNHLVDLLRLKIDDVKAASAKSEDRRGTGFLTLPELRVILDHYLYANELTLDKGEAKLDASLTAALFKKHLNPPIKMSRQDLNLHWISKMEEAYALVEMPGSKIVKLKKGLPPKVTVEVEKRQSQKFITRVRGVEEYGIDAETFCRDVSKRFACAGAIETDVGRRAALKKNQVELVFQGHLAAELHAFLSGDDRLSTHGGAKGSDYTLPKQAIEIDLKRGVQVKRNR